MEYTTLKKENLTLIYPTTIHNLSVKEKRSLYWAVVVAKRRGLRFPFANLCALQVSSQEAIRSTYLVTDIRKIGNFFFVRFKSCAGCHSLTGANHLATPSAKELLDQTRRCPLLEVYWFPARKTTKKDEVSSVLKWGLPIDF